MIYFFFIIVLLDGREKKYGEKLNFDSQTDGRLPKEIIGFETMNKWMENECECTGKAFICAVGRASHLTSSASYTPARKKDDDKDVIIACNNVSVHKCGSVAATMAKVKNERKTYKTDRDKTYQNRDACKMV